MAKDKLGNTLEVGDLVQLQIAAPYILGRIKKITPPGQVMVVGGQKHTPKELQKVTFQPEEVKIVFDFDVAGEKPGEMQADTLLKCHDYDTKIKSLMQQQEREQSRLLTPQ